MSLPQNSLSIHLLIRSITNPEGVVEGCPNFARICPNFLVRKPGESHSQKLTGQHCALRDIRIDPGCGWNRPHCSAVIRFWYRSDAFGALCWSLRVSPSLAGKLRSHIQKSQSRSETGIFEIRDEIAIVMLLIRLSVFLRIIFLHSK